MLLAECGDLNARDRRAVVGEANGQLVAGRERIRVLLGDQLEREAERRVLLLCRRWTDREQRLGAAREALARRLVGLPARRAQAADRVEAFVLEVRRELARLELDRRRTAA